MKFVKNESSYSMKNSQHSYIHVISTSWWYATSERKGATGRNWQSTLGLLLLEEYPWREKSFHYAQLWSAGPRDESVCCLRLLWIFSIWTSISFSDMSWFCRFWQSTTFWTWFSFRLDPRAIIHNKNNNNMYLTALKIYVSPKFLHLF